MGHIRPGKIIRDLKVRELKGWDSVFFAIIATEGLVVPGVRVPKGACDSDADDEWKPLTKRERQDEREKKAEALSCV